MVYLAMGDVVDGHFKGGVLNGTLENGGVGLAPFHGLESRVPISLPAKLDEIKRGIAEGSISVDPASYVGTYVSLSCRTGRGRWLRPWGTRGKGQRRCRYAATAQPESVHAASGYLTQSWSSSTPS